MKVRFSHEGGWSGGEWRFEGMSFSNFKRIYGIDPFPRKGMQAELVGPNGAHAAIVSERTRYVHGEDNDHGHTYPWSYREPMFLVGNCPFPVDSETIWSEDYTIILEVS